MGRTLTKNVDDLFERGSSSVRLCLVGAEGRLGQIVAKLASEHDCEVVATVGRHDSTPLPDGHESFDVVVDVSSLEGVHQSVKIAEAHKVPLLECVTGLDESAKNALMMAESKIPVLQAANTAIGMAILRVALRSIGRLTNSWTVTISETHHAQKVDRPSGTARRLAEDLRISGKDIEDDDVLSKRVGEVVGEHKIIFSGEDEVISFQHQALDRRVFARGVLRAACWLAKGHPPGRYSIEDTLGDLGDPSGIIG
jgi:4-hydroxy-tetrahydrodipicolinate reductase